MKQKIREFIPNDLWRAVRKYFIIREHRRVGKMCCQLIDEYYRGNIESKHKFAKKKFEDQYVIWQYWDKGFDNVPEIVRLCLNSVESHKGRCKLIRLDDSNLSEYIDFPEEVLKKRDTFSRTAFSDLLRLALLTTYGGAWLYATVFLTGPLPESYFTSDFFVFQRDNNEKDKDYWEKSYAYYWGWYKGFKVRMLNSVFFAKSDSAIVADLYGILLSYWIRYNEYPHYFFFQILYNELITRYPKLNCPIVSDCVPHYIMQMCTDNFSAISLEDVLSMTSIHKLTYKMPDDRMAKFKSIYNNTAKTLIQ